MTILRKYCHYCEFNRTRVPWSELTAVDTKKGLIARSVLLRHLNSAENYQGPPATSGALTTLPPALQLMKTVLFDPLMKVSGP